MSVEDIDLGTKICRDCNLELPMVKFGKITHDRRKPTCNRCTRARLMAKTVGVTAEEYLTFSEGCCQICGEIRAIKAYFHRGSQSPSLRLCPNHRMMFRSYRYLDQLNLIDMIVKDFPFWTSFLKKNNLHLFRVDS